MLGVGPYITATIIMQLLTIVVPSLAEMQKEGGEAGRAQINQYTRYMTIPLAPLQGFGTIRLLQSQGGASVLGSFTPFTWFMVLLSITTGTMLMMWIGEIMSEFDVGNGVSLIIFAGIVARIPANFGLFNQLVRSHQTADGFGFCGYDFNCHCGRGFGNRSPAQYPYCLCQARARQQAVWRSGYPFAVALKPGRRYPDYFCHFRNAVSGYDCAVFC